ncbi:MAG TPA: hypothetical protein VFM98_11245 [Ramlibacter sp.]|uniref:hypothetical protein n=1 Tax=Ramlibacter sp. TaxID=1917967 RepID=UPI002D80EA50|nr:hypothetical protein [Ramlibacter sp.]HET8746171.1 hypothetical protein [Ramlibacter sp.]
MKYSRILFAAVACATAFAAQAQVGTHGEVGGTPAEAQAKATPARPSWATRNPWSTSYNPLIDFRSLKTREQVRAELMEGRRALLAYEGYLQPTDRAFAYRTPPLAY